MVRLTAHESVLDGAILANGTAGSGPNGGGGSGGSVLITTAKLTGTGRIEANGGGVVGSDSGTGGGGQVALLVADLSGFDPANVRATGGAGTLTGGDHGGAGTILVKEAGQTDGSLIVDNRGIGGALTPLCSVGFGRTTALTETVLTDPAASFPVPDPTTEAIGLTGLRVNPNLIQGQTFSIVDNAGTTLTITEGDFTTVAEPSNLYLGVYAFDNLTVAGGARLVTADAVSVRFHFSIDATSSLTSNVELRNIPVPILTTASGTTRLLTVTLPAVVGVPITVVAASGNPGIAAITAGAVIPAGQISVDLAVTGESSGETPVIITAGTQIRVIRVAVDVPPVGTPVLASSPVLALVAPAVLDTVTVGVGGTGTVTLTLATPAPAGGLTATALSQNPAVTTVASPFVIPAGAQTFVVELTGVAPGETTVVVQVGAETFVLRVLVGVTPPVPTVVSAPALALVAPAVLDTVAVGVGGTTTVTLTLATPAPAEGLTATVASQNPAVATVISLVAIPAGAQTFVVELTGVAPGETTVVVQVGEETFVLRVLVGVSPPVPTVVSPVVEVNVLSLAPQAGAIAAVPYPPARRGGGYG